MGLNIGQIPAGLAANQRPPRLEFPRREQPPDRNTPEIQRRRLGDARPFTRDNEPQVSRAGFGEGTISPLGAAFNTLDRGLREARRIIPTVEETRANLRDRLAEAREQFRERRERGRIEVRIPEPSAQARNFVNQVNDAAGTALNRVEGAGASETPRGASIEIGGETIRFSNTDDRFTPQTDLLDRPRLDILA